jgi:holin-like protein
VVKFVKITLHIIILCLLTSLGNWIQHTFQLLIPGSVIGMIILFLLLLLKIIKLSWIDEGAKFMVRHLTLFFIPATVGIIDYLDLFLGKGILLFFIVIISTIFVMVSSGWISQWLMMRKE